MQSSGDEAPQEAQIFLEPDLRSTFIRHGRRRLREIQEQTQAVVKLDRTRGMLRVIGTAQAIKAVQQQLECLEGPRTEVTAAAWAELMRTRTLVDTSSERQSAVSRIQQLTGCRLHIERGKAEVRLFGERAAREFASKVLEQFQELCSDFKVPAENLAQLSAEALHLLAHQYSVTLRVEEKYIDVLGFDFAVKEAAEVLKLYIASPSEVPNSQQVPSMVASKVEYALAQIQPGVVFASTTTSSLPSISQDSDQEPSDGNWRSGVPAKQSIKKPLRRNMPAQSAKKKNLELDQCPICPSCNARVPGNFCVNCGHARPTENNSVGMSSYAAIPVVQMSQGSVGKAVEQPAPCTGQGMGGQMMMCMPAGMMPPQQNYFNGQGVPVIGNTPYKDTSSQGYMLPANYVPMGMQMSPDGQGYLMVMGPCDQGGIIGG